MNEGDVPDDQASLSMGDSPRFGVTARWGAALGATGVGALQLVLADVPWFFAVTIVAATVLGALGIGICSLRPRAVTPADLLAAALCMAYGVGTANTFIRSWVDGIDPLARAFASLRSLAETLGYVLIVVAALLALGGVVKTRLIGFPQVAPARHRPVAWLSWLFVAGALVMLASGQIGYQGNVSVDGGGGRISPTGAIIIGALTPMAALAAHCAVSAERRYRTAFLIVIGATLLVMVTQGRRLFVFSLLLCLMGYFSAGAKLPKLSLRAIAAVCAGLAAVQLAAKFFFAMRLASYDYSTLPAVGELVSRAWEIIIDGDKVAKIWLQPISVEYNHGYNRAQLNYILKLTRENRTHLLENWNEYFAR